MIELEDVITIKEAVVALEELESCGGLAKRLDVVFMKVLAIWRASS